MRYSFYCYFKVDADNAPLLALRTLQAGLLARAGVAGRLLRRRDDAGTWMEVYEGIPDADAFRRLWLDVSAECGLVALSRHEEWFQPLD